MEEKNQTEGVRKAPLSINIGRIGPSMKIEKQAIKSRKKIVHRNNQTTMVAYEYSSFDDVVVVEDGVVERCKMAIALTKRSKFLKQRLIFGLKRIKI